MNPTKVRSIIESLEENRVTLVAVTKLHTVEEIQPLYDLGIRNFGENRVQELLEKVAHFPGVAWHLIGHLQRNKVKYIAPFISCIHSIDSEDLLAEINRQAEKNGRVIDGLLQVHVAQEASKFGFPASTFLQQIREIDFQKYPHVRIRGVMGMASMVTDQNQIRAEFQQIKSFFDALKSDFPVHFDTVSMGMSGDFDLAIKEGSTLVRLGSILFEA
ncbi:MAG: YggS family pyridoxal phosphate-dependent enzyme [Bacteroidia bacterium]